MARARGQVPSRRVLIRTIVLDSEGLSKAANDDPAVRGYMKRAADDRIRIITSAATLTEVLRGASRDAGIHRVLRWVKVEDLTPDLGRRAGELLGATGLPPGCAIDAMVAATALAQTRPVVVLTSDPKDLSALVEDAAGIGVVHI